MTNCEQYERLILERFDRPLSKGEEEQLSAHLADCASCRSLAETTLRDAEMLRRLPRLPHTGERDLKITSLHRGVWSRIWHQQVSLPLPVAAGLALLLLGAYLFSRPEQPVTPSQSESVNYVQVEVIPASSAQAWTPDPDSDKE